MAIGETVLGFQETPLVPGSDIGRLGDAAAAAEKARDAGTRDTTQASDPAVAADAAAKAAKETADAAAATVKTEADTAAAAKLVTDTAAAEKAVTDAKTPEEKAAAEKALEVLKGPKDTPGVAPEKYADFKLPEGITPDPAVLAEAAKVFKELNLSQSQAQKLVEMDTARTLAAAKKAGEDQMTAWNGLLETRLAEAKADPKVGGSNWDQSIADAGKAIKELGTPALQAYLNRSDAGSHVEVILFFAAVGKAIGDDQIHFGSQKPQAAGEVDLAKRLFPNQK